VAERLKGSEVTQALNQETKKRAEALAQTGIRPTLAVLRVGAREDDLAYERGILKRAGACGVLARVYTYPETIRQEDFMTQIERVNEDPLIHGVLIFCPLPSHLDERAVRKALKPEKDIDGITDASLFGVFAGREEGFPPCTPDACREILRYYQIPTAGKRAVVVGRSLVVGRPLAMMLMEGDATVTICHTKTKDLAGICRQADILIAAAGRAKILGAEHVSENQVVLDVGIHASEDGALCGDVDFEAVEPIVGKITPVPGGVGTVTTSILMSHVVTAAERSCQH
jgi:methylenetetrahydrofolate dehydrogenase (NADP+)/methenyltetrahydrofolate cyclohydrolase